MRISAARIGVAVALAAVALALPQLRHAWNIAVTTYDAAPSPPAPLPAGGTLPGLAPIARTRVVLIDGLTADAAHAMPAWSALCDCGTRVTVDVGFPTVSLAVEVALWSGLTQQQSGVVDNGGELVRAPPALGIPAQVAGSWAVAEDHGFIVGSLGFARTESGESQAWIESWQARARAAVASEAALVFVHVLRVDHAGHRHGAASPEYRAAAAEADAILAALVGAQPDARWFVLSDHGHLPDGGHGGEEREVRQVESCLAGPGVPRRTGGPIHVVDLARALADSTGVRLPAESRARALDDALAAPLADDDAVPGVARAPAAIATILVLLGLACAMLAARRWWLAPWWFVVACATLVLARGEPTLSTPMTYAPTGRAMYETWLAAVALAAVATYVGLGRTTLARVVAAQLALPVAVLAAAITLSHGWGTMFGAEVAPVVPRFTAWVSALLLLVSHGCAAMALAVIARGRVRDS